MSEPIQSQQKDHILKGIASVCGALFLITTMLALGKMLYGKHHVIEVVFYRNMIGLIPMVAYLLMSRKYHLLRSHMPGPLFIRVAVGSVAVILTFAAMQLLPMANATVIFFASTLIIPVMAHVFLKEKIGFHRWLAVAIGMSGVLLIARPSADLTMIGVMVAFGAAIGHAIIQIMLRYLRAESSFTVTFYFLLGGGLLCALFMPFVATMPTKDTIFILLALGSMAALGQYLLTVAFHYAPASVLNPFNYTGLIWSTGFDILIWHHMPGWPVFAGSAIIIAANFYILHRERVTGRAQKGLDLRK